MEICNSLREEKPEQGLLAILASTSRDHVTKQSKKRERPTTPGREKRFFVPVPVSSSREKGDNFHKELFQKFVRETFPDFYKKMYFVPPVRFNAMHTLKVDNLEVPDCCTNAAQTPDSKIRSTEAVERLLQVLNDLPKQQLFVMSEIDFDYYLNKQKQDKKTHKRAHTLLQTPKDLEPSKRRGTVDVLVVDKFHGVIILEVKSVGDTLDDLDVEEGEQMDMVVKVLEKSHLLLKKEQEVIRYLLKDLISADRVSARLVLPNLKRNFIQKVLKRNADLQSKFQEFLETEEEAIENHFLCADELPARNQLPVSGDVQSMTKWWSSNFPVTLKEALSSDICTQIVGRFCGPLSTMRVKTGKQDMEVHTLGQAVSLAGQVFTANILSREHLDLLDHQLSENRDLVHLSGPPGTGKTLLLTLKGVQFARAGHLVCVLWDDDKPSPVSFYIYEQIIRYLGDESDCKRFVTRGSIQQVIHGKDDTGVISLTRVMAHLPKPVVFIMDGIRDELFESIHCLLTRLPMCKFWCTGTCLRCDQLNFDTQPLKLILRRPPSVQKILSILESNENRENGAESMLCRATSPSGKDNPEWLPPTSGPRAELFPHVKRSHSVTRILDCEECGHSLAQYLKETLCIGSAIEPEDVIILTPILRNEESLDLPFLRPLAQKCAGIQIITDVLANERELTFPEAKKITLTSVTAAIGLEKKVVVFIPEENPNEAALTRSRFSQLDSGTHTLVMDTNSFEEEDIDADETPHEQTLTYRERLKSVVEQMTQANRQNMWYALSRCVSHAIIFFFTEDDLPR